MSNAAPRSSAPIPLRPTATTALAAPTLLVRLDCGQSAPGAEFGDGWGMAEAVMRWTIGPRSSLTIEADALARAAQSRPPTDQDWPSEAMLCIIDMAPYIAHNPRGSQRISVTFNGITLYQGSLMRRGLVNFRIPATALDMPITLIFEHPDARSPAEVGIDSDRRPLGFAVRTLELWALPKPPALPFSAVTSTEDGSAALAHFDSLGDNCEFGIAQRLSGHEPLGLLRFTATPLPALFDLLLHEFEGLGDPASVTLELRGEQREYILNEIRYNLTYHTFVNADQMAEDRVRHRETQKLTLLRRRMLDDLRCGRRIYIVKRNDGLRDDDVWALFLLLRRFGPNRLLYVAQASHHAPGHVMLRAPGLAYGTIDRFAPYSDAAAVSLACWHALCSNALQLLPIEP